MNNTLPARYAQTLLELAESNEGIEKWQGDIDKVSVLFADPEVQNTFENRSITIERKMALLEKSLIPDVLPLIGNFVKLAVTKYHVAVLPRIADEFRDAVAKRTGVQLVDAYTAAELKPKQQDSLGIEIAKFMKSKQVNIRYSVDPSLIGGIKLRVGDSLWDGSVKGQLNRMQSRLSELVISKE